MLRLIYGTPRSGKTYKCDTEILSCLKAGKKVTLVVPEQEAVEAENRIYDRAFSDKVPLEYLTVASFRRLANIAFRKHGGISYNQPGNAGKLLLLYRIIEELSPALKIYSNAQDRRLSEMLLGAVSQLIMAGVSPSALSLAAEKTEDEAFREKAREIALIYAAYSAEMSELYSDPTDDINRLAELYRRYGPDTENVYFFDSFNGFTYQEIGVIESVVRKCDVTVTLNMPSVSGKTGFMTSEKTDRKLREIAGKYKIDISTETVSGGNSVVIPAFSLIRERLFDFSYCSDEGYSDGNIELVTCKNPYYQAEYIAADICRRIRAGARYKDIAVVSRNTELYNGTTEAVFERYGIPVFNSKRTLLSDSPICKTLFSVLDIASDGFRTEDILSYAKSGFCPLTAEQTDLLENYVSLWNIDGKKRWTSEENWTMNPKGYSEAFDEKSEIILAKVNSIRNLIITPLKEFSDDIRDESITGCCKALYRFIEKSGLYSYMRSKAGREEITAYNSFMQLLQTFTEVLGDIPANAVTFGSLIKMATRNTDYGKIPENSDSVTFGDAKTVRLSGKKHIYLADCENGVFPAAPEDNGFFSEKEKMLLSENGIDLSEDIEEICDDELFYFLRCAVSPQQTLTALVCYSGGELSPSVGFNGLKRLFPGNKIKFYPGDDTDFHRIQTGQTLFESLFSLKKAGYSDVFSYFNSKSGLKTAQEDEPNVTLKIDESSAKSLVGKHIYLTSSRIDDYVKCPFMYYCRYVLKLKERKYSYFRFSEIGRYIHSIMEKSLEEYCCAPEAENAEKDIAGIISRVTEKLLIPVLGEGSSLPDRRFGALTERLRRNAGFLLQNTIGELKSGKFSPVFFELEIGGEKVDPLKVPLGDGSDAFITGKVDRVDVFRSDRDIFLRVVDYKSGAVKHTLAKLSEGIDMQMLLYMFALLKNKNPEFLRDVGGKDGDRLLPAGVMYQPAKLKVYNASSPLSDTEAKEKAEESLVRSGLFVNNLDVLEAMESELAGKYIPVKPGKDGTLPEKSPMLISEEDFMNIYGVLADALKNITEDMKHGVACAKPNMKLSVIPCRYCKMYPVCRSRKN